MINFQKIIAIIFISVFLLMPVIGVKATVSYTLTTGTASSDSVSPTLNVDIPGVSFSQVLVDDGYVEVNFLAEYISGLYKYLLAIAAIFAVIMIMIGGIQYILSPGGKGKDRIIGAVTGLILLFSVYLILYTVNPSTTLFEALKLKTVDPLSLVIGHDNYDTAGSATLDNLPTGIICPRQQGVNTVADIANSFVHRTAYRYGGKGGPPPYNLDTHISDCGGTPCKDFCPDGNICLDCSGFVNAVRACAGLNQTGNGTAGMASTSTMISECTSTSVNGTELTPGDLILWRGADEGKPGQGHVIIYIGDGQTAESVGSGRAAGSAVKIVSFSSTCNNIKSHPYRIVQTN